MKTLLVSLLLAQAAAPVLRESLDRAELDPLPRENLFKVIDRTFRENRFTPLSKRGKLRDKMAAFYTGRAMKLCRGRVNGGELFGLIRDKTLSSPLTSDSGR